MSFEEQLEALFENVPQTRSNGAGMSDRAGPRRLRLERTADGGLEVSPARAGTREATEVPFWIPG